jgi:hypothetical protein
VDEDRAGRHIIAIINTPRPDRPCLRFNDIAGGTGEAPVERTAIDPAGLLTSVASRRYL